MSATAVISEAQANKKATFEREALPHLEALLYYALRLLSGDEDRAEDMVQESFLRAYGAWHTYERGSNCKAWLMTILRNVIFSEHASEVRGRRARQVVQCEQEVATNGSTHRPDAVFFEWLIDDVVLAAIDGLPVLNREAFVLKEMSGLRYEEIAQLLEVPLGTVKSRLFRARQGLQRELYEYALEMGYVRATLRDPEPRNAWRRRPAITKRTLAVRKGTAGHQSMAFGTTAGVRI